MSRTLRQAEVHQGRRGLTLIELLAVLVVLAALGGIMIPLIGDLRVDAFGDGEGRSAQEIATLSTMQQIRNAIMGSPGQPGYFSDMGDYPRPTEFSVANPGNPGPRPDHPQLRYLFINPADEKPIRPRGNDIEWDPSTKTGWRGPYMLSATGAFSADLHPSFLVDEPASTNRLYGDLTDPRDGRNEPDPALLDAWGRPIVIQEPLQVGNPEPFRARLVSAGPNGVIDTPPEDRTPDPDEIGDDLLLYLRGVQ